MPGWYLTIYYLSRAGQPVGRDTGHLILQVERECKLISDQVLDPPPQLNANSPTVAEPQSQRQCLRSSNARECRTGRLRHPSYRTAGTAVWRQRKVQNVVGNVMDVVTERKALNAWRKIGEAQRLIRKIVLQGSRPGITQILCEPAYQSGNPRRSGSRPFENFPDYLQTPLWEIESCRRKLPPRNRTLPSRVRANRKLERTRAGNK